MLPIVAGIVSSLIQNNLPKLAQAVVDKGVEYVQEKTGIKLEPEMSQEQIEKLRAEAQKYDEFMIEQDIKDRSDSRDREVKIATSQDAPMLNKVVTPVLALGTVGLSFLLFGIIIFMKGLDQAQQNILIYVLGALNAATVQVLSYYFGASHDHKKDVTPSIFDGGKR